MSTYQRRPNFVRQNGQHFTLFHIGRVGFILGLYDFGNVPGTVQNHGRLRDGVAGASDLEGTPTNAPRCVLLGFRCIVLSRALDLLEDVMTEFAVDETTGKAETFLVFMLLLL
jgi:hypothetical protein